MRYQKWETMQVTFLFHSFIGFFNQENEDLPDGAMCNQHNACNGGEK